MTKEELTKWKEIKVTKEVIAYVEARKMVLDEILNERSRDMNTISSLNYVKDQSYYLGMMAGLDALLDIEVEDESTGSQDTN